MARLTLRVAYLALFLGLVRFVRCIGALGGWGEEAGKVPA